MLLNVNITKLEIDIIASINNHRQTDILFDSYTDTQIYIATLNIDDSENHQIGNGCLY